MSAFSLLMLGLIGLHVRQTPPLRLVQTIPLPGVEGRIDHLAADIKGQRLFVAALGNNTVEVLDIKAGSHLKSLSGFHEPQGIAYLSGLDRVAVANGQGGGCVILDGATFRELHRVADLDDADNVRATGGIIYVGFGNGSVTRINGATGADSREPYTKLQGHPESFQIATLLGFPCVFVNVPTASHIAVLDSEKLLPIGAVPVTAAKANFPMAADDSGKRLFIGCRKPPRLLLYGNWRYRYVDRRRRPLPPGEVAGSLDVTGVLEKSLEIHGDVDDIFWDSARKRLYVSCGEGFIDILQEQPGGKWDRSSIPTAPGARTSLYVPALNRLYLAVPHRGNQMAEIRVYDVH